MKFGRFKIRSYNFGGFRLDGGSMFGSVPKSIWSRRIAADADNCIALCTRSLLIEMAERTILVDTGMGDKWSDKERAIYAIRANPSALPVAPEKITDLILTHLHFDHAGGVSYRSEAGLKLTYPNARIYLQKANLENAKNPTVKERASYLADNFEPIQNSNLTLVQGSTEILPDLWVHQVNGHTLGQQWIEVKSGKESLVFPTDLIPTSHHLPLPFHMGYDACASTLLNEKQSFLERAVAHNWLVVFEHDPVVEACRVVLGDKGHYQAHDPSQISAD